MDYIGFLLWMFAVIGFISVIVWLLMILSKFFDTLAFFLTKIKIYIYYPIIIKINRKKHKDYVEEYFNNLLFRGQIEWPLAIGKIKIEWSDEESVNIDLEEGLLLVRVKYTDIIEDTLAKIAFLSAPYLVSKYLEPALGEKFSRLVSFGIVENILQTYPRVLTRFKNILYETYGRDSEYREILNMIVRADDTSLYKHVFLYELRRILGIFGTRVDRDKLIQELKELLHIVANLENIDIPEVCGYYVNLTIVRVGKLVKVVSELWEPYIQYIRNRFKECPDLQRIYLVSAGKFKTKAAEGLIKFMKEKLPNIELLDRFEYKARYYKGKTNIPYLVVIMEFK